MRMVEKATTGERLNHLVLLVSFFVLMFTGLGFLFQIMGWLNSLFGGIHFAAALHKWSGVVFVFSLLITIGNYMGESMSFSPEDSEWISGLGGYFSHKQMPEQGRLNAGQKLFYLCLLVFGLAISISGMMLWLGVTAGTLRVSHFVHNASNVVLITAIPMHVYLASIANPGTARIMSRGTVPVDWAKKKHAKWVKSLGIE